MSNTNDESVDFKVDLSKSPEEIQKEHKEKKESAKAEEPKEVEAKAEETTEQVVEEKETGEEVEVVEEKKEEEEQPEQKITKEQLINEYLTDNFDMNVDKLKDVLSNSEQKEQLPEEVEKYLEYKKDTKRGLSDYVKLQQDIEAVSAVAEKFEIIILKELTKIFEERIYISHENYKKIDLKAIKGELVLAVNLISSSQKQEELSLEYISNIVSEMGIKKAYQVVKTKYKISRNKFYEMAINIDNE